MKKYFLIFIFLGSLVLLPKAALAAIFPRGQQLNLHSGSLIFDYNGQKFVADEKTINSWQQPTYLPAQNQLTQPASSYVDYLKTFYGQPASASIDSAFYSYSPGQIFDFVQTNLQPQINQQAQEPQLTVSDNKVVSFTPPQDGVVLNIFQTVFDAETALTANATSVEVSVSVTKPKNSLAQTNNLGINELIAEGVSGFKGSPNNRRHNIAVGLEKFKGIIVPQGAEFSFDDNLGPVTAEAGFLPELVIKGSQGTIPELGGGLCQVSTTTFRAAMAAGLPITARRNHAYAVQYYSPQGTDATIYPGSADLKFINDTPGAILIWPYEKDKDTLVFDFYGTKDSRQVTLEKPVVYDRKSDGSMKATWTRDVVLADGSKRTDVFKSTYQPPALFHKTEQFVNASSTPSLQMPKVN